MVSNSFFKINNGSTGLLFYRPFFKSYFKFLFVQVGLFLLDMLHLSTGIFNDFKGIFS